MLVTQPVKQQGMRSAMEHVKAVIEEVDKMNDANAIREVLYLSWLFNKVVSKM